MYVNKRKMILFCKVPSIALKFKFSNNYNTHGCSFGANTKIVFAVFVLM